jgi:Lactate racemase N-terminal domain
MKVELLYGKATIEASVPSGCRETLIRKQPRAPLLDPHGAVLEALARPIGAPPLADYARGKRSACILICDITRPVPNHLFLRPLIEQLMAAGMTRAPNSNVSSGIDGFSTRFASPTISRATTPPTSILAEPGVAAFRLSSTADSSRRRCELPPAWSSRISWPDTPAVAKWSRPE